MNFGLLVLSFSSPPAPPKPEYQQILFGIRKNNLSIRNMWGWMLTLSLAPVSSWIKSVLGPYIALQHGIDQSCLLDASLTYENQRLSTFKMKVGLVLIRRNFLISKFLSFQGHGNEQGTLGVVAERISHFFPRSLPLRNGFHLYFRLFSSWVLSLHEKKCMTFFSKTVQNRSDLPRIVNLL